MSEGCNFCGETTTKLLRCGRCNSRFYCGSSCPKEDWPAHESTCKPQNFVLRIVLWPQAIVKPRITRTLSCPSTSTFSKLHEAIQVVFDWSSTHAWDFDLFDYSTTRNRVNKRARGEPVLKIKDMSIFKDHHPDVPTRDSAKVTLGKLLGSKSPDRTIHYNYDFGDC
ncbi:HIT/MYND zinc finger-like protein [Glarea lozoyensis ATCC 20868]|uniref:HIT/MYND zinc finger-like protein n=1 Tax=Glarea lozoyensis (strain ATCC 20868 / MF5171) TaxID=1116229 RepID=S3CXL7_GLAL2|nr:HIT/MYND zinc finger-like protein [Glarea lozoyensis ATCC 20868]EPE29679.1 HIT/MYND zinc finger-like protein [Glarea lozoyensis ATCC 20868]